MHMDTKENRKGEMIMDCKRGRRLGAFFMSAILCLSVSIAPAFAAEFPESTAFLGDWEDEEVSFWEEESSSWEEENDFPMGEDYRVSGDGLSQELV